MIEQEDMLIRGVFYDSPADGPTILLKVMSGEGVRWLHEVFVAVANSGAVIDLAARPEVSIDNIGEFRLRRVDSVSEARIVGMYGEDVEIACTEKRWREFVWMLEPFLEGRGGHQYLDSDEGRDEATVVVSYGESGVQV